MKLPSLRSLLGRNVPAETENLEAESVTALVTRVRRKARDPDVLDLCDAAEWLMGEISKLHNAAEAPVTPPSSVTPTVTQSTEPKSVTAAPKRNANAERQRKWRERQKAKNQDETGAK